MDLRLRDRLVLVTGGASGIGEATARGFAAEGARIVIWDISPKGGELALRITDEYGVDARAWSVDVTSEDSVREAFNETQKTLGVPDHLVHAAAIGSGKFGFPYTNLSPSDWLRVLDVNILGMVQVAHALGPAMRERKSGTMIFIASVAGQIGSQTDPPYSAAKAANINFAQCLAKDLAPFGVRVNTVCPGMVMTPLNRGVWEAWNRQQPDSAKISYEEWGAAKIKSVVPLNRWQTPEDIANMIVFLSSEKAQQVTGQTINVDGGFVMHW